VMTTFLSLFKLGNMRWRLRFATTRHMRLGLLCGGFLVLFPFLADVGIFFALGGILLTFFGLCGRLFKLAFQPVWNYELLIDLDI